MLKNLLQLIEKQASWKKVVLLFFGSGLLAVSIITMFFGSLELDPKATMDSSDYYDSAGFYQRLDQQGPVGRQSYLILHLVDYVFMIAFALFILFTTYLLLQKVAKSDKIKYLSFIPLLSTLSDLLENLSVDISLLVYPRKIMILANLAGYFTVAKMMILYVSFGLIVVLVGVVVIQTMKDRFGNRSKQRGV